MGNIYYYWYDHCVLRETGETEIVENAIKNHDFKAFKAIADKYPDTEDLCYFPTYATQFMRNGRTRKVDITTEKGFNRITASEYECG